MVLSPATASLVGEGTLSAAFAGSYNKASFDRDIRPVLTKLDKTLEDTPELTPTEERDLLARYVANGQKLCTQVL